MTTPLTIAPLMTTPLTMTPLMMAAGSGDVGTVKLLLKQSHSVVEEDTAANKHTYSGVDAVDNNGLTALGHACLHEGNVEVVRCLLHAKASPFKACNDGAPPLVLSMRLTAKERAGLSSDTAVLPHNAQGNAWSHLHLASVLLSHRGAASTGLHAMEPHSHSAGLKEAERWCDARKLLLDFVRLVPWAQLQLIVGLHLDDSPGILQVVHMLCLCA